MHLHLRVVAVVAGILFGVLVCGWGAATTARPGWWGRSGARWWVGWTREPVPRVHGAALAVVGVGLVISAVAAALTSPAAAISATARTVQLIGLGVVILGGVALTATHPRPADDILPAAPPRPAQQPTRAPTVPIDTPLPESSPPAVSSSPPSAGRPPPQNTAAPPPEDTAPPALAGAP